MSDDQKKGSFFVVAVQGNHLEVVSPNGSISTMDAVRWARNNLTPKSGCSYAVIQLTKKIGVNFKPQLVEEDAPTEFCTDSCDPSPVHPDGTVRKTLTDGDAEADLAGTPRPDNPASQAEREASGIAQALRDEAAAEAGKLEPIDVQVVQPPKPPAPPVKKLPPPPKPPAVAKPAPVAPVAAVTPPVAAPAPRPAVPKAPPLPKPAGAKPVAAPVATPPTSAGGGGLDDLDIA